MAFLWCYMDQEAEKKSQRPDGQGKADARGRGRPKPASDEVQRVAIADVAAKFMLESGYQKTTMKGVAAAAHVSLATIYRLFPSKSELFGAIVGRHRETIIALPGDYDGLPVDQALQEIFRVNASRSEERDSMRLMARLHLESQQSPDLGAMLDRHGPTHSRALLCDWLERQQKMGRIRPVSVSVLAQMLMDIVFGAASLKSGHEPGWPGGEDRAAYLRTCLSVVAYGMVPNDPDGRH
ncbi:TetR/AcrR family transcriptional regulator [Martelella alba]|uniref:TetR/AcrR family transcriptional regulator n=1 Tax=Martelella alba TaxID=2590451 RepID=A0A506U018_9HYPH|nr:TetR/AcrR family transcriptional regulator [Martelella alba]TPW27673.1 TetR/AcrR family transcriptional regulator [Martelella alba]